jgi:hypothetical protein
MLDGSHQSETRFDALPSIYYSVMRRNEASTENVYETKGGDAAFVLIGVLERFRRATY